MSAFLESAESHEHSHRGGFVLAIDTHDHRHETAHFEAAQPCHHHDHACVACVKQLTSHADLEFSEAFLLNSTVLPDVELLALKAQRLDLNRAPRGPPACS